MVDRNMKVMMELRRPEVVYLNIYHITKLNSLLELLGVGFYHTSVLIHNHEFSFGGHDFPLSGVVSVEAGNNAGLTLKEQVPVGITYYNEYEIEEIINKFGEFWHGIDYDPFGKNCNSFTAKLIEQITNNEEYYYPSYINRFTKMGSLLRMWFRPIQRIFGDIVNYEEDNQVEEAKIGQNYGDAFNLFDFSAFDKRPEQNLISDN